VSLFLGRGDCFLYWLHKDIDRGKEGLGRRGRVLCLVLGSSRLLFVLVTRNH